MILNYAQVVASSDAGKGVLLFRKSQISKLSNFSGLCTSQNSVDYYYEKAPPGVESKFGLTNTQYILNHGIKTNNSAKLKPYDSRKMINRELCFVNERSLYEMVVNQFPSLGVSKSVIEDLRSEFINKCSIEDRHKTKPLEIRPASSSVQSQN